MTRAERDHEYKYCRDATLSPHRRRGHGDNLRVRPLLKAVACASALSLLALAACTGGGTAEPAIVIGVDLPLSGAEGQAGGPALNGIRFFVKQHPVLDGFTVGVNARDDAVKGVHDPKAGAQNVAALIADPHVMGIIGPLDASVARTVIPLANKAGLAMISPSVSNRCLTKDPLLPASLNPTRVAIGCAAAGLPLPSDLRPGGTNNFFRLATTDDLQGAAAADFAYTNLHLVRVGVLSDHETYGQALAASFRARFTRLGGLVVKYLDFAPSATVDLGGFMQQAKADGAQGIYFGGVTANNGCSIRAQMATVFAPGAATPYLGGDGIAEDPACVRAAGNNAAGIYATVPVIDPDHVAAAQPVITAFKAEYGNAWNYSAYTMLAYDAAAVLYDALDRAIKAAGGKLPARADVIAQLAATKAFPGVTGPFGFDADGDTTHRVISVFEATGSDPGTPWSWVAALDYTAKLPY